MDRVCEACITDILYDDCKLDVNLDDPLLRQQAQIGTYHYTVVYMSMEHDLTDSCDNAADVEKVVVDAAARKEIGRLKVRCPNKKCELNSSGTLRLAKYEVGGMPAEGVKICSCYTNMMKSLPSFRSMYAHVYMYREKNRKFERKIKENNLPNYGCYYKDVALQRTISSQSER